MIPVDFFTQTTEAALASAVPTTKVAKAPINAAFNRTFRINPPIQNPITEFKHTESSML